MLAACLEDFPASPCPSYRRPILTSFAGRSPEIIHALPNTTYTDRALEGLSEVDEAEKGSMLKSDGDFMDATQRDVPRTGTGARGTILSYVVSDPSSRSPATKH